MEPAKLLEHFGVMGVALKNASIGLLGRLELTTMSAPGVFFKHSRQAYVSLLFIDMADLEQNVRLVQRRGWVVGNVLEALLSIE